MRIYLCNQYRVVLLATLMLVIGLGIEHRVAYANSCESGPARRALIIGNYKYPDTEGALFNHLIGPRNDVNAMSQRLIGFGFKVTTAVNTNAARLSKKVTEFANSLGSHDIALVYYSGHGLAHRCNENSGFQNYLIPVWPAINEVDKLCAPDMITTQSILAAVRHNRPQGMNILIFDACRNKLAGKGIRDAKATKNSFVTMSGGGAFVAYATGEGGTAYDTNSPSGNSLYTEYLLGVLNNNPSLPIESVFQTVRQNMYGIIGDKQIPWDNNGLLTSFVFGCNKPIQDSSTYGSNLSRPPVVQPPITGFDPESTEEMRKARGWVPTSNP
ncbi:hypothetical protein TI04_01970 [Achromatium sp. WMS2]|nr:hypothetical protein TI04_01970 [Achromatium sp. WMS2]